MKYVKNIETVNTLKAINIREREKGRDAPNSFSLLSFLNTFNVGDNFAFELKLFHIVAPS